MGSEICCLQAELEKKWCNVEGFWPVLPKFFQMHFPCAKATMALLLLSFRSFCFLFQVIVVEISRKKRAAQRGVLSKLIANIVRSTCL